MRKDEYRICNISQKSNVKICACALSRTCKPKMAVHPQSAAKESRGFYEEVTAPPSHSKLFVAICVYHIKDIGETFRLVFSITSATQRSNICMQGLQMVCECVMSKKRCRVWITM